MEKIDEDTIVANLKKCHRFCGCSLNLCPLDWELFLRNGGCSQKCRFMRETSVRNIKGKRFISGGTVMPDVELNFVPTRNLKWLNTTSQKRWFKLHKKYGK